MAPRRDPSHQSTVMTSRPSTPADQDDGDEVFSHQRGRKLFVS
jgi:hypothetical protein